MASRPSSKESLSQKTHHCEFRSRLEGFYGEELDDKTFESYQNKIIELSQILIAMHKDRANKKEEEYDKA